MVVVKLGGSLEKNGALIDCLNRVESGFPGRAVVIVPGGGSFADQVRQAQQRWRFDDGTAHDMALLAMQQMALMIRGLMPHFRIAGSISAVQLLLEEKKTVLWSPDSVELDRAGIRAGWEVTSDSLAAWLAMTLSARELILIKSANMDVEASLAELARQNVVDRAFCDFVARYPGKMTILNYQNFLNG
ncbi:MAG: amino acid kinase family protein [Gammaproteobacteria bacterium]